MLIIAISPSIKVLNACRILNATTTAWALASIVVLAVQCSVPRPWDFTPGRCVNQVYFMLRPGEDSINLMKESLYDTIGVFNILTDAAIFLLSICMMWDVHVHTRKRFVVVTSFSMRLL